MKSRVWNEVKKGWLQEDYFAIRGDGKLIFLETPKYHVATPHYKVSRSTGIFDKNNLEIFEGDIIKFEYIQTFSEVEEIGCVQWNEDGFWELMVDNKGTSVAIFDTNVEEREVIGNLYESPSLLGKPEGLGAG